MNLIEKIQYEMFYDEVDSNEQSEKIKEIYHSSQNKDEIDNILICLCGYGMDSLEKI